MSGVLSGKALIERFTALDQFLFQHRALWRANPFYHLQLAWEQDFPQLAHFLRTRSLAQAEQGFSAPDLHLAAKPFPGLLSKAQTLNRIGCYPKTVLAARPERLMRDVPGRKWQQIQAFAESIQPTANAWLDWCAGKGHLGRFLAYPNGKLSCLEYDPVLVVAGQQLSQRAGLTATHIKQDVMDAGVTQHLHTEQCAVALHACGDLHCQLITQAAKQQVRQLAIAPCCYNRTCQHHYQALSQLAQNSLLQLSKDELGLPLQSTVTAGQREINQRNQSMAWRLAFDLLQRQITGNNQYLPTPSLPGEWWKKDFALWCLDLAKLKGIDIAGFTAWAKLEQQGWQRLAQVRNLELVRKLFQRPLELWLVLDRAVYLQEQGYCVELAEFCAESLTPRNLLIRAQR